MSDSFADNKSYDSTKTGYLYSLYLAGCLLPRRVYVNDSANKRELSKYR